MMIIVLVLNIFFTCACIYVFNQLNLCIFTIVSTTKCIHDTHALKPVNDHWDDSLVQGTSPVERILSMVADLLLCGKLTSMWRFQDIPKWMVSFQKTF